MRDLANVISRFHEALEQVSHSANFIALLNLRSALQP
jgi:hypothetical protein